MNWIQDNKALATLFAVITVVAGGLGFWLYGNYSDYSATQQAFDRARSQVKQLESQPLYPDDENVEAQRQEVDKYKEEVRALWSDLLNYQPPRRTPTANEFQARLNRSISQLKEGAEKSGTGLPEDFAFGMLRYTAALPSEAIAPEVDWQLDALIALTALIVDSGVGEVTEFSRTPMKAENPQGDPTDGATEPEAYTIYPVEVRLVASQDAFQNLLNALSQPGSSSHYLIPRLVRIENESAVGPPKGETITPTPVNPGAAPGPAGDAPGAEFDFDFDFDEPELEPGEDVEPEPDGEIPDEESEVTEGSEDPVGEGPDEPDFFSSEGASDGMIDTRIILGQEKLKVYLRVDLLDFNRPSEVEDEGEEVATDAARSSTDPS